MNKPGEIASGIVDCWLAQKHKFATEEEAIIALKNGIHQAMDDNQAETSLVITRIGKSTLFKLKGDHHELLTMLAQVMVSEPTGALKKLFDSASKAAVEFQSIKTSKFQA